MNDTAAEDIQEKIDDFILDLLPPEEQKKIESLIAQDENYNKYYLQQKELIELSQPADMPDPGAAYWQSFPDQVLEHCKETPTVKSRCFLHKALEWWRSQSIQSQILQPVLAFTFIAGLAFILINRTDESPEYNAIVSQQVIWSDFQPSENILMQLKSTRSHNYAFSKTDTISVFSTGQHYALSIAYFFQQDYSRSLEELSPLKSLNLKDSLDILNIKLKQNRVDSESTRLLFNDLNTQIKKQLSADEYALFIMGSWLTDIQIALASKQYHLLRNLNKAELISQQLESQSLPDSIYSGLEKLNSYFQKEQYSRKELYEINNTVSNLKSILE